MEHTHRILIVEDEMVISMELAGTLRRLGYDIAGQVTRGEDAIEQAGLQKPSLILMDIRLQGEIDGIEAADTIRNLYDIPVVFLTAHSDENTLQRAIAAQPSGYLMKPFRDRELYSTIELSLHKHALRKKILPHFFILDRISSLPDSLPCLIISSDRMISGATDAAATLLGTTTGSLIQTRFDSLFATPPVFEPVVMPEAVKMKREDGTVIPITMSLGYITNTDGSLSGCLVVLTQRDDYV
jgi:CheY-like chemotaxis protein